jgi:probable rRNA maturation factor
MIRNRQRTRALDIPLLRRLARHVLETELDVSSYELGLHFVAPTKMAEMNQYYLGHEGSTDVITFDYSEGGAHGPLHGELFICVADAVTQARNFDTTWPSEVVRYIIHGLLHLRGFDDLAPRARRIMKREEERLLKKVSTKFKVCRLAKPRD